MKAVAPVFVKPAAFLVAISAVLLFSLLFPTAADCFSPEPYHGCYSGRFDGASAGFWIAVFDEKGFGRFVSFSDADQAADYGIGNITSEGRVTFQSYLGMSVEAKVNSSGAVSGQWSLNGNAGTMEGARQSNQSLQMLAGSYNGTYDGDDSGTWRIEVGRNGIISGYFVAAGTQAVNDIKGGAVNADGKFAMRLAGGTSVTGDLNGSGSATGTWYKHVDTGSVNGSRKAWVETSGSGGCFIGAAVSILSPNTVRSGCAN